MMFSVRSPETMAWIVAGVLVGTMVEAKTGIWKQTVLPVFKGIPVIGSSIGNFYNNG